MDGNSGSGAFEYLQGGENLYFWEDLSTNSNLIEGGFNTAQGPNASANCTSMATCSVYFPYAKIGNGNFLYVYSGYVVGGTSFTGNGPNFFGLSIINSITSGNVAYGSVAPAPGLSVNQAYNIDKKN